MADSSVIIIKFSVLFERGEKGGDGWGLGLASAGIRITRVSALAWLTLSHQKQTNTAKITVATEMPPERHERGQETRLLTADDALVDDHFAASVLNLSRDRVKACRPNSTGEVKDRSGREAVHLQLADVTVRSRSEVEEEPTFIESCFFLIASPSGLDDCKNYNQGS